MRHAIAMLTLVPVLSMASIGLSFDRGPGEGGGGGEITAELHNASGPAKAAYYSGMRSVKKRMRTRRRRPTHPHPKKTPSSTTKLKALIENRYQRSSTR